MCFGTSDEHDTNDEPAYVLVQKIMKFPNRLQTITAEGCRMTGSLANGIQRPDRTAMTLTVQPFEFMPLSCILDIWEARENICRTFVSRRILQVVGIRNVDDRTRNQLRIVPTHGDHGHIVHVLSSLERSPIWEARRRFGRRISVARLTRFQTGSASLDILLQKDTQSKTFESEVSNGRLRLRFKNVQERGHQDVGGEYTRIHVKAMGTIPVDHPTMVKRDSVIGDLMPDLKQKENLRVEKTYTFGQRHWAICQVQVPVLSTRRVSTFIGISRQSLFELSR